jgi:hypothetical protein
VHATTSNRDFSNRSHERGLRAPFFFEIATESTDEIFIQVAWVGWAELAKPNAVDLLGITSFSPTYRLPEAWLRPTCHRCHACVNPREFRVLHAWRLFCPCFPWQLSIVFVSVFSVAITMHFKSARVLQSRFECIV